MTELKNLVAKTAKETTKAELNDALTAKGLSKAAALELVKNAEGEQRYNFVNRVVRLNGFVSPGDELRWTSDKDREKARIGLDDLIDVMGKDELRNYIPRVMTTVVREAVEPVVVLQNLFRRIDLPGAAPLVKFPSVGGLKAADIGEGMSYPEQKLNLAGYVNAMIGKSGVKIALTEEAQRYTSFGLVDLHVRAAGRALARHKERKCADVLENDGTVSFDNSGGTSLNGSTSGRNFALVGNDTITVDDLFQMYADVVNAGYIPTDFVVNPIGWLIFAREPSMRAWAFWNGAAMMQNVMGQPGNISDDPLGPPGGSGSSFTSNNQSTTMARLHRQMWPHTLGMVVSPFVAFDTAAKTTTIHLVDREEVGVLVQDEDIVTDSWEDPSRDIFFQKWRERYGVGVANAGEAIMSAKEVSILKGHDWENKSVFAHTGELPAL